MMNRREFMALVCGAAVAWLAVAHAQQQMPVIGFMHVGSQASFAHLVDGLRLGLKEAGFVEGKNVAIEYRWAEEHPDRLPTLAADLVRRPVAVILAGGGTISVRAAKAATATIPIVFVTGGNPVAAGLVESLARPGGNSTGVNLLAAEVEAKRFGLLHDIVPGRSAIAYLANPKSPAGLINVKEVEAAAKKVGRDVQLVYAATAGEIAAGFAAMEKARPGALLVGADPFFNSRRAQIVSLAARLAIPAIYEWREFALAGGLLSYGTSLTDAYRLQGVYAGRILKGEMPGDLPVQQATKFELVLNLQTARSLGVTFPPGVLAIADEVIE